MEESSDARLTDAKATPGDTGCAVNTAHVCASCAAPTAARILPMLDCCIKHGGGRKCKWSCGCTQSARIDGYCLSHYREVVNPSPPLTNEELDILTSLLGCVHADCDELGVQIEIGPTDAVSRDIDALLNTEGIDFRDDVHIEEIAAFLP
ncbi:unnamed protein product [Aphanomyces euteiches]